MNNTSINNQSLDLFGDVDLSADLKQKEIIDQTKADQMKLLRAEWIVAVTTTGELFKYNKKVPSKYRTQKGIKLFKCCNEATADLVLNAVKGAVKYKTFEIPEIRKKNNKRYAISHWIYLVERRLCHLPFGHLENLYREHGEKVRKKRELAAIQEKENTYDVEPH